MAKKADPKKPASIHTAFRLTPDELALLDSIADHKAKETGLRHSRADAIRMAARHFAQFLGLIPRPGDDKGKK